jgi:hypothetical protein
VTCDKTWNRPILERQNVRDIDPAVLEALQSNDRDLIRAEMFNLEALRRKSRRIDEFAEVDVQKQLLRDASCWTHLKIDLSVPFPTRTRLDRLLASELDVSRTQLNRLQEDTLLRTTPDRTDTLRRRISSGTRITVDLSGLPDRELVWRPRAAGLLGPAASVVR